MPLWVLLIPIVIMFGYANYLHSKRLTTTGKKGSVLRSGILNLSFLLLLHVLIRVLREQVTWIQVVAMILIYALSGVILLLAIIMHHKICDKRP